MLRIGLIGLGYWGPNYARVITELPESELVVVCDASSDALDFIRSRAPGARTATNADDVFTAEDVDAVVIATPTSTHYALALAALVGGKHVLCEKPLAATVAECDELIDVAARNQRVLFVGHTFLFNPAVRRMRSLIEEGAVGKLLYAHAARTGLGPIRQDVNALWDLAPHDLSILFHLFGQEPVSVSATGQAFLREGVEDVVFAQLRFGDGAIAGIHVSWLDPYKVRRVTAVGEQRMVVFDDIAVDEKLKVFDKGASYDAISESARGTEFGEYRAVIRDGDILIPKVAAQEPLKEQVLEFIRCCETGERPATDGVAGRRVVAVLEAATESLRLRGAPVDVAASAVA
ncbi:MAG: Gfo/Idh/MocA family protein [Gaiellaceae bacterium]